MEIPGFADKFLRTYREGETIFSAGDIGQHMYVVRTGAVNIMSAAGGREECLKTLQQGDIFGEMALIDHLPRSAAAVAGGGGAEVLEIDHPLFVYLVGQQPAFALIVMKALSLRLRSHSLDGEPSLPPAESKGGGVVQIRDNIYQLRGRCMSYLVRGRKKNLLIDTGLPWESDQLESQLNSVGLDKGEIHMIILTHEHLDHIGGLPLFPAQTVVASHVLTANKIAMQDEFVLMSKSFRCDADAYHVDIHLHDGTEIDLGGYRLRVIHSPGHSSGSISLYEPDQQVLFTGDTLFANGILGGIFPSGSVSDYALTLRRLSTYRVQEFYPGHGRISQTPADDFDRAIKGSMNLIQDTCALFNVLDSRTEFAEISKAIATYARRV